MAIVNVTGTFISANLKESNFEGKKSYSVQIDLYQPTSPQSDKMVTVKCDDVDMLQLFQAKYKMGDELTITCSINAYRNQAYYKMIDVLPNEASA